MTTPPNTPAAPPSEPRRGGPLVRCTTCRMSKHPIGRDPGIYAANGYCGHDCPGYREEPIPDYLWPNERADGEPDDDD